MKSRKIKHSIFGILFGILIGVSYEELYDFSSWHIVDADLKSANVCFTPPKGCAKLIAREIGDAESSIYIHAYGLTSEPIINSLIDAANRGVTVKALLDSSNFSDKKTAYKRMKEANIEIILDKVPGIAHNKIMIIDEEKVITGSFNFTKSADTRNAENVLLVKDKRLASIYLDNWEYRYNSGIKY